MTGKAPKGWYDITVPLKQGMIYLPIDPVAPRIYRYSDRNLGAPVTMSMLEIISIPALILTLLSISSRTAQP